MGRGVIQPRGAKMRKKKGEENVFLLRFFARIPKLSGERFWDKIIFRLRRRRYAGGAGKKIDFLKNHLNTIPCLKEEINAIILAKKLSKNITFWPSYRRFSVCSQCRRYFGPRRHRRRECHLTKYFCNFQNILWKSILVPKGIFQGAFLTILRLQGWISPPPQYQTAPQNPNTNRVKLF